MAHPLSSQADRGDPVGEFVSEHVQTKKTVKLKEFRKAKEMKAAMLVANQVQSLDQGNLMVRAFSLPAEKTSTRKPGKLKEFRKERKTGTVLFNQSNSDELGERMKTEQHKMQHIKCEHVRELGVKQFKTESIVAKSGN